MKKITRKRFLQIWVPFAVILSATVVCCTLLMNSYSTLMDVKFGKGERKIVNLTGDGIQADYYPTEFSSAKQAEENGKRLCGEIAEEGIVLLKNNGVLPLERGSRITPFGYHYLFPNYGPSSGSAMTWSDTVSAENALKSAYDVNGGAAARMKSSVPQGLTASGYIDINEKVLMQADVIEYDPEIYRGIESGCAGSVGVVFIGRAGGEGNWADITSRPLYDGTPHGLAFTDYEMRTLGFAKRNCDKLVVILNCCNPMELSCLISSGDVQADAVLWVGGTGSTGFESMVNVMTGKVSPSGRLPDVYVTDSAKNPVYANYGSFYTYSNVQNDSANQIFNNFLEYEEGVYNGYRYYETAAVADPDFVYGKVDEYGAQVVAGEVTYPFGYGLSYSEFEQSISRFRTSGNKITVEVNVKNVGKVAAKDAVQIYFTPPYTDFSVEYGMEKSAVTLAGFAKTKLLKPDESVTVTVTFNREDMASYSSLRNNGDGTFGCYILEEGEYAVSLRNNSHDVLETRYLTVQDTVYYDNLNPRSTEKTAQYTAENTVAATNKFDDLTRYMNEQATRLTRNDWKTTQPEEPVNFIAPDYAVKVFENNKNFNPATDGTLGDGALSERYKDVNISSDSKSAVTVASLRGVDYNDPAWNELLDKLNYNDADLWNTLHYGYMQTGEIKSIGLPSVQFRDGPLGITATLNDKKLGAGTVHCSYCAMPVLAATFNTDLAYEYGKAVAIEALWHNDGQLPVSGWYAPGLNVHRGPFGGRYYEYFSEDPLLIGLMGAGIASGAADNGLSVVIKHFAANNQDTARNGLNTWVTEQTLREIYLRPYEICIKNSKTQLKYLNADGEYAVKTVSAVRGIMSSKNSLGATFCGANYALLTGVLKDEWNFEGMVITDILISGQNGEIYSKMLRSGVNVLMGYTPGNYASGMQSDVAKKIVRECVHSLCFIVANSNAMQGVPPNAVVTYGISPWLAVMIALNVIVACFIIAMSLTTYFAFKKREI